MKNGKDPSTITIAKIANYLDVSTDYPLGLTDDPTPPKKREEMTEEKKLSAEVFKMTPDKKANL